MVENVETRNSLSKSSSSQQSSFTLSIKEICNAGLNRRSPNRIKSLFLDRKIILPFRIGEVQSKESALLLHWVEFMVPSITLIIELSKKFSFPY